MNEHPGERKPDGFDLMSKETLALIARDLLVKAKDMKAENETLRAEVHRFQERIYELDDDITCESLCLVVCAGPCVGDQSGSQGSAKLASDSAPSGSFGGPDV